MKRLSLPITVVVALSSTFALANIPELSDVPTTQAPLAADGLPSRPVAIAVAPNDTVRLAFPNAARERVRDLDAWFSANPTQRVHVQTDRPLYRPGDTVNVKLWDLATKGLLPAEGQGINASLIDPRGTVVQTRYLAVAGGAANDAFVLDAAAVGGSWKLQVTSPTGQVVERAFTVASFQAPRIKKTLEFARDGYGPGDAVEAAITLERATGEKLINTEVTANVQVDGTALPPMQVRTDGNGEVVVKFTLPAKLTAPDVLLTVMVDDAGVTESISRSVPIVLDRVAVGFFPEGGDLVAGIESRVYFEATDPHGAPADVKGVVLDDRGREVAKLGSWVDGRGHFTFTPEAGRSYRAKLDAETLEQREFALPVAKGDGCVMHHFDDLDGVQRAVRVSVACTTPREVTVFATQQEAVLDRAVFNVAAGAPTTVYLQSGNPALAGAQGVARVTVFDGDLEPLAERLVYRNKSRALSVKVTTDRAKYAPKDQVALTVRTTDPEGRAVPAEVSVAVVDDTVLAFADDKEDGLVSRVLLQADLPEPIEGVAQLFEPGAKDGGLGVDLALATRGWRRFDWEPVKGEHHRQVAAAAEAAAQALMYQQLGYYGGYGYGSGMGGVYYDSLEMAAGGEGMGGGGWGGGRPMPSMAMAAPPMEMAVRGVAVMDDARKPMDMMRREKEAPSNTVAVRQYAPPQKDVVEDAKFAPRSDFRDTVLWQPSVRTGADGAATLTFALSDAVTGFRATAEGVGGGYLGHGEALLASTLPFHLEVRLPVELSAGDRLNLPVTLENQRPGTAQVDLSASVGSLLQLGALPGVLTLGANERRTIYVPVVAKAGRGDVELSLSARSNGLTDGIVQKIPVAPRGFPQTWTASGVLEGSKSHSLQIPTALEGSITGKVTVFPSPVSEILKGMENMVRTPGGCFEQTSSTNYPNVVVLDLLDKSGNGGSLSVDRKQVLDAGYGILTGYQISAGGFETWGDGPGKEALSAFGLMQFSDMSRVYDVDSKVIDEDVAYLMKQRNGKGGYLTTGSSAHGYGTAPPEVLDAYITYALVSTGHTDIPAEIAQTAALAKQSNDPYRLALATLTLLKTRPEDGKAAAVRLAKLQIANGSFPGSETSITRSENFNLDVEATALAAMALLGAGDLAGAQEAVRWLHESQTGAGAWGATQGNALALKAIGAVAQASAKMDGPGHLVVTIDGKQVAETRFAAGERQPQSLDLGPWLSSGSHTVAVTLDGAALPYALETGWSTELPISDAARRVDLQTSLDDNSVALGHTTRLTAKLTNRTNEVVPEPIARIGLPAGLEAQTWQLAELKKQGKIAFFETRPREVTIYWDGISAQEIHEVALDLVATVPGSFTGPASSAYPYYDDQAPAWVRGLTVEIAN